MVNIAGFMGHRFSIAATQLYLCNVKVVIGNKTNGQGCVPATLYLQNGWCGQPAGYSLLTSGLDSSMYYACKMGNLNLNISSM